MDLKAFFQKVKDMERAIRQDPVVVVSQETSDGGRAGAITEVSRPLAAKLIVEGRARLADEHEISGFETAQECVRQKASEQALAGKVMINLVPQSAASVVVAPAAAAPPKEPKKSSKE